MPLQSLIFLSKTKFKLHSLSSCTQLKMRTRWQTHGRPAQDGMWKKFSWHLACRLTKYKKEFDRPLPSHAPFSHSWHHSYATGPLKFKRNFSTLDVAQGKSSLVILPHSILIQHLKFNGILHRLKLFPRYKYYLPPNSFCSATNADLRIPSLLHITIFQCKKCNQFIWAGLKTNF